MTNYDKISKPIGEKHWQDCIVHDDGTFALGGKSTALFSQPGTGKTTLMCYMAQMSKCLHTSKVDFVKDLIASAHGEPVDFSFYNGKVFQETVIWRARDADSFANILTANWATSFKGKLGSIKQAYLWVHENDKNIIFYSYNHKRQEIPVANLPPPQFYKDAEDLIGRLHWGAINIVLEPQTYRLSHTIIQRLREKKMDSREEDDRAEEYSRQTEDGRTNAFKKQKREKTPHRRRSKGRTETDYERKEVSPSYFWFELIHIAHKMNKRRHIMICIDEIDDVFEARSEGDVWKLIEMLANDWKTLRKMNISTVLSTHETQFIDWRIMYRIDYIVWLSGARVHAQSTIKAQSLVSNLPMGMFLIERRAVSYGQNTFGKIPLAQPVVRIDGLKGENFNLSPGVAKRLLESYAESWGVLKKNEIIDLDSIEVKKEEAAS